MAKRLPNIQVVIPYRQLCELLEASGELDELRKENAYLKEQILALRMMQGEFMEKLREIDSLL